MTKVRYPFIPKEISWLSFNNRVLSEARNSAVPLLERLRFLGIYANNMDEFYRVRVALLRRFVMADDHAEKILGGDPQFILNLVQEEVFRQGEIFEDTRRKLHDELRKIGVVPLRYKELSEAQVDEVRTYFRRSVRQHLFPIMFEKSSHIPDIEDGFPYLVIHLVGGESAPDRYAVLRIPTDKLPRFRELSQGDNRINLITLDDIIRVGVPEIFTPFTFESIKCYAIKLTKDAELEIEDDVTESYREQISRSVKARRKGEPIRFEFDHRMPDQLVNWFRKRFSISRLESLVAGGSFRNYRDYLKFPDLRLEGTSYRSIPAIPVPRITQSRSILEQLKNHDLLLHYPYHSFDTFITFLREASFDPRVREIRITLYRLSNDSLVANALINAAQNGKKVVVTLELQARFDEVNNLYWSERMSEAGIKVIHGVPGVKVHAKLCLVEGIEKGSPIAWAAIGTGNFNENTAKLYTDTLLMTMNKEICSDAQQIFRFLDHNYIRLNLSRLVLSPYDLRDRILLLIDREIANAQSGKYSSISVKMNQLVDVQIQDRLVQAARSGVSVRLLIRGMCSLAPEPGDNIEVRRIVDRFLEHSRFMIFHNDGDSQIYISSADWMVRNLDRRIEVTAPILDPVHKQELIDIFEIYWKDDAKAVYVEPTLQNLPVAGNGNFRAQVAMIDYLREKAEK